jgi:lipoic acid synthetase
MSDLSDMSDESEEGAMMPRSKNSVNAGGRKLPPWLRRSLPSGEAFERTARVIAGLGLETVCTSANCPNRGVCWARNSATVMILGKICTRNCSFCAVEKGIPTPPDPTEPVRVGEMAALLEIDYFVITSVTRDDLPDGGAGAFGRCAEAVRRARPDTTVELLTPDFARCRDEAVEILAAHLPFVFSHNIETVPQLYTSVRGGADYRGSLRLLAAAKERFGGGVAVKSSIMLGLGESDEQVEATLRDLRKAGCDGVTIGQYLKPSKDSLEVAGYVEPAKFEYWGRRAAELGFSAVSSEPFARSSYLPARG